MPLIDTGPLIAFIWAREERHRDIVALLRQTPFPLLTTQACITEAMHFLGKFAGVPSQLVLAQLVVHGEFRSFEIDAPRTSRIHDLMSRYANVPMDYADATLIVAAEDSGDHSLITFDSDFQIYRLSGGEPLTLVGA